MSQQLVAGKKKSFRNVKKLVVIVKKYVSKQFPYLESISDREIVESVLKFYDPQKEISKTTIQYIMDALTANIKKKNHLNTILPLNHTEEKRVLKEYLFSIDSKDRDKTQWLNTNEYSIDLGGIHTFQSNDTFDKMGFISKLCHDIVSIELISAVVPKHSVEGDALEDYPYLILEIDEIPGIYEGTNQYTNNAFAKIRFRNDLGTNYKEYTFNNGERFVKYFDPRITLKRMTFRWRKPNGYIYNFGTWMQSSSPNEEHTTNTSIETDMCDPAFIEESDIILGTQTTASFGNTQHNNTHGAPDNRIPSNHSMVFKFTCLENTMESTLMWGDG